MMAIDIWFPDAERVPMPFSEREKSHFVAELKGFQAYVAEESKGLKIHVSDLATDGEELARYLSKLEAEVSRDITNARYARIGQTIELRNPAMVAITSGEEEQRSFDVLTLGERSRITGKILGAFVNLYPEEIEEDDSVEDDVLVPTVALRLRDVVIFDVDKDTGEILSSESLDDGEVEIPLCYGVSGLGIIPNPTVHRSGTVDLSSDVVDAYLTDLFVVS